jgi:hypothetical protein
MCTACVSQGLLYVGGAVGTLRVMAARAEHKRAAARGELDEPVEAGRERVGEPSG